MKKILLSMFFAILILGSCNYDDPSGSSDITSPVVGGGGTLSFSGITSTSVTVNWTTASDETSAQANLVYRVYYSTSNNISTVSEAQANGTSANSYTANIASFNVTGLSGSTTYYFNVLVQDEAGNQAAYTSGSQATPAGGDTTPPTAGGSGTLTFSSIASTSVTVNWTAATDNTSAQANLQYLVYFSTSNNINSVANIEANGTASGTYTANITTRNVTSLIASTTYYFNLVVKDEAGNKTAYTANSQSTTTPYVYRSEYESNSIVKSNIDGTGASTFVSDAFGTGGSYGPIAIAAAGGYVFWATDEPTSLNINRVDTDGTNSTENFITVNDYIYGIYADEANGKVYWAEYSNNRIRRANFDGTGLETVISTVDDSGGGPYTVVADSTYVYWATDTETGIERALLNGSGETTIIAGITAAGLGIDTQNNKLYYADYSNSKIVQCNLDGSSGTDVVTGLNGPGAYDGLEYYDGMVFWNEDGDLTVQAHNADGSGSTIMIDSDGGYESGVCVSD